MAVEQLGGASAMMPSSPSGGSPRFDVAVVEPDSRQRMRLGTQLAGAAQFEAIEELVQHLRPGRPVVAVFGPGLAVPYGFQQVHRLVAAYPELGPVFAVDSVSTDLLQAALRAGARDTVAVGDAAALTQSVGRVGELLAGSSPRVPAVPEMRGAPGRLIAVFSTKGGVGKSTVAINTAVAMARRSDERIALVDGDLQFGDVAVLLGLPPQSTVLDAAAAVQYSDPEMVRALLARHDSGLLVLPAPTEPVLGAPISPSEMVAVCEALQSLCARVVVDLPTQFDDYVLAVIDAADEVLLVGSMDIPSVKNLKIGIHALDLQAIAGPKLRLVLNRANTQVKLDVREIEQVLGLRAEFPIPSDIAVPLSVNAGVPVVDNDPRSAASRALEHIASAMLGSEAAVAGGGRRKRAKRGRK
jgi:pilus assembly protein CpaE